MTRRWTDEDLYQHFGLTSDERDYIEATIQPRSVNLSLDSPIPASHLPGGYKYSAKVAPDDLEDEDEVVAITGFMPIRSSVRTSNLGNALSGKRSSKVRPDQGRRDDQDDRAGTHQAATRHRLPEARRA